MDSTQEQELLEWLGIAGFLDKQYADHDEENLSFAIIETMREKGYTSDIRVGAGYFGCIFGGSNPGSDFTSIHAAIKQAAYNAMMEEKGK